MNDRHELRRVVDARLSGLTVSPEQHMQLLRRAHEEEQPVKKKISVSFAFALMMLALAATACAAVMRFSVLDYNSSLAKNEAFVERILNIDESHENEFFSLTVNDAVFDGTSLSLAMNILPKEGAGEVFVIPRITAQCGDKTLFVDIEGCTGGDFWNGFWVPGKDPDSRNDGCYGVDCVVMDDWASGTLLGANSQPVVWTVTLDVLRPEYPIELDPVILDGENDPPFDEYMDGFRSAYQNGKIRLAYQGSLVEYISILPCPEGMTQEDWNTLSYEECLVRSGTFSRVETLTLSFTTDEADVKTISAPQTFEVGDHEITIESLLVTVARADYRLSVAKKPGTSLTAAQEYEQDAGAFTFAVLSPTGKTMLLTSSYGAGSDFGGNADSVVYQASIQLSAPTDELIFLPIWNDHPQTEPNIDNHLIMTDQLEPTKDQKAAAITVKLD